MAYICGSRLEDKEFRLKLERKWKTHRDSLILMNNNDPRAWAKEAGQRTINDVVQMNEVSEHDLTLVLLYKV